MLKSTVFRRRNLPHLDIPGATYFVTTCLEGSIPAQGLLDIEDYRNILERRIKPPEVPIDEWEIRMDKLVFARADEWLDLRAAVRHLADPKLAAEVREAIAHFSEVRYDVFAYVVMPSHMHWIFKPRVTWIDSQPDDGKRTPREIIMHSLKRFSAVKCNEHLRRDGTFWQAESYDHCIRDLDELMRCIEYVENNPVRAGLVRSPSDWLYSSARERPPGQKWGVPLKIAIST